MFEKIDVNDLYLAYITVVDSSKHYVYFDGEMTGMVVAGLGDYGFLTVLRKMDERFEDLHDSFRKINTNRESMVSPFVVDYIKPFSVYYNKKEKVTRKEALLEAQNYYDTVLQEYRAQFHSQQREGKSL